MFCYEGRFTYPVYLSNQEFKDCMDLLLIVNENKSHYGYIKDFDRFMCNQSNKEKKAKNIFVNVVYSILVVKKF